ncbi:hypothetical protein QQX98_000926 [Neonectria punicea]|uniref:PNPLA domain-containing protein n=1 Tax=Neonectria punicea TaxID=979145 RepID=A0ABR1HT10_9HYPO
MLNTPVLLRSYDTDDSVNALSTSNGTIREAARANSAAATFFDPIQIGRQEYVDGATGYNNPVEAVLDEARSIWKDLTSRVQCLVSIGTGVPDLRDFGDNLKEVVNTLKAIATETEQTEKRFFKNGGQLGVGGHYFRFNVNRDLRGVGLDEHQKLDRIEAATEEYLRDPRVKQTVETFVSAGAFKDSPVDAEEKHKYPKWLPYIDPLEYHNIASQYRTTKSAGGWFLNRQFETFKERRRSFLWLYAKAGSGKTSKLPQDLRHFKCTLLTQIVRGLVSELPNQPGGFVFPKVFRRLYNSSFPSRNPKAEDLDATFCAVLGESESTYIVVDTLDECASEEERADIVAFLADLVDTADQGIHVLITSRREEYIETAISNAPGPNLIVSMEVDKVNEDIRNHLEDRIAKPPYNKWEQDLRAEVVDYLVEHADGVFRWADLQLRSLRGKLRRKDVEKALSSLPKNLPKTYGRMLEHIDAEYPSQAISILRWLAYSDRPLVLAEAAEIAAFECCHTAFLNGEDNASVTFPPEDRFHDISWVRRILAGLVTISGIDDAVQSDAEAEPSETLRNGQISFSHFSVKEYLESDKVRPPHFRLTPVSGQCFIIKGCLTYMISYDNSEELDKARGVPYTLLPYACQYLWSHFRKLCGSLKEPATERYVEELTSLQDGLDGVAFRLSALATTIFDECEPGDAAQNLALSRARQFVVEGQLPEIGLRKRLDDAKFEDYSQYANIDFDSTSSLHTTSSTGHFDLVKMLLDSGLDVNMCIPDLDCYLKEERASTLYDL